MHLFSSTLHPRHQEEDHDIVPLSPAKHLLFITFLSIFFIPTLVGWAVIIGEIWSWFHSGILH